MPDSGYSFDSLIASLSGLGSTSGNLANTALTGNRARALPLLDYSEFGNHVFFGNAVRKFNNSMRRIKDTYPVGLSAGDLAGLSAENIYKVDEWKKESSGYDLYLLDKLSDTGTVTASSTNANGETVFLTLVRRSATNTVTGSQTAIVNSISAAAVEFEELNIDIVKQTTGSSNDHNFFAASAEKSVTRSQKLVNMLPGVLFQGDDNEILEKLLQAMGDMLDELKGFADQISYLKHISYDDVNRTPNKFLPVLAAHYGITLYQSAVNSTVESFFTKSTTGLTTQEVSYEVWNRILNNLTYLLKNKGTRETIEAIGRIYGMDHNLLRVDEFSILNKNQKVKVREELDVPVLVSSGDVLVQLPSSVSAFDNDEDVNFTLEFRVSATSGYNTLFRHPLYQLHLDSDNGQAIFVVTAGTSAFTAVNSSTAEFTKKDKFTNIIVSRSANLINIWAMGLSGSGSGGFDEVVLASGSTAGAASLNYDSSGGFSSVSAAYFPGHNSFNGYMHEVRAWNTFLHENDLKEHTRNFESTSIISSTASPNNATNASLLAHYKLKENVVLPSANNYIVDSTTAALTATPVNFGNQATKRYRVFSNHPILSNWYPTGLTVDNDKVRQENVQGKISDPGTIGVHFDPINVVNRDFRSVEENLNIKELLGDPEDLYKSSYTGPFVTKLQDIMTRYNTASNLPSDESSGTGLTGAYNYIADINAFVDTIDNFNDVLGGVFKFIEQFIPAKSHLLSQGILIEPHALNRPKHEREEYSLTAFSATSLMVNTRYNVDSVTAHASASTTATFQGYKLGNVTEVVTNNVSASQVIPSLSNRNGDSFNVPRFFQTRIGRAQPIRVEPDSPDKTDVEVTITRLLISPTASVSAAEGIIDGGIQLLRQGKPFRTDTPSLKFEFPVSADGTNYFIAEIGDITNGRGRIIEGKDREFTTNIATNRVQMKLKLAGVVRGLANDSNSLSGEIGVVPINITNLFNKKTQVLRVAIGNRRELLNEISNQGGITLES